MMQLVTSLPRSSLLLLLLLGLAACGPADEQNQSEENNTFQASSEVIQDHIFEREKRLLAAQRSDFRGPWPIAEEWEVEPKDIVEAQNSILSSGRFAESHVDYATLLEDIEKLTVVTTATAREGDMRLLTNPYWSKAGVWLLHRALAEMSREDAHRMAARLYRIAMMRNDPAARWALEGPYAEYLSDQLKAELAALPEIERYQPPSYGYYPQADLLIWSSGWGEDDDVVVLQGHDAGLMDAFPGQVGVAINGVPSLVNLKLADNPSKSVVSPLRLDGQPMADITAPIMLRQMDAKRGSARFDLTKAFPQLSRWHRDVFWNVGGGVRIVDQLTFHIGQRAQCVFSWPLAEGGDYKLIPDNGRTILESSEVALIFQTREPVKYQIVEPSKENGLMVPVLQIETVGRPAELKIMIRVVPRES